MRKEEKDGFVDEAFDVLLRTRTSDKSVCKKVPQRVQQNYVFLIDTSALNSLGR
jgi:hypothetical protein